MSVHDRSNYLPRSYVATKDKELKIVLDYMNAPYLNLSENITKYSTHVISQSFEGRPDLISYKLYSTVDLWWVVCQFNGVINPFTDLRVGMLIKVPDYSQVMHLLHEATEETQAFISGKSSTEDSFDNNSTVLI